MFDSANNTNIYKRTTKFKDLPEQETFVMQITDKGLEKAEKSRINMTMKNNLLKKQKKTIHRTRLSKLRKRIPGFLNRGRSTSEIKSVSPSSDRRKLIHKVGKDTREGFLHNCCCDLQESMVKTAEVGTRVPKTQ